MRYADIANKIKGNFRMHPYLTAMLYQRNFPLFSLSLSLFIKMLFQQYSSNETEDNIQWKKRKEFMKDGSNVFRLS